MTLNAVESLEEPSSWGWGIFYLEAEYLATGTKARKETVSK